MFKKLLVLSVLFVSFVASAQDLKEIRLQYPLAVKSSETTEKMVQDFSNVNSSSKPILLAYKGAFLTLKAKFSKSKNDKKEFFKEGVSFIESALKADSSNIEIRYLRLSIQENSPKFLGYHKNIEEDKTFIMNNLSSSSSAKVNAMIKEFMADSKNFDQVEK